MNRVYLVTIFFKKNLNDFLFILSFFKTILRKQINTVENN